MLVEPSVSAVEHAALATLQGPSSPEGCILVIELHRAAREVAGWCRRELYAGYRAAFPPIEFTDPIVRNSPAFEVGPYAKWDHPADVSILECQNRLVVEMVVVVMGDQDHIDCREGRKGERWLIEALRSSPGKRRSPFGPDRIDESPYSSDFNQVSRMPKPGHSQAGFRRRRKAVWIDLSNWNLGFGLPIWLAPQKYFQLISKNEARYSPCLFAKQSRRVLH